MDEGITRLVNLAQISAVGQFAGQRPTPEVLASLAAVVRANILTQAAGGLWQAWNVLEATDLEPLVVRARLGNRLLGEPMIKLEYNWARTKLARLLVDNRSAN